MAYKVVVPVSGGKDSQACLQRALEDYPPSEILGLFCDTQFEHPLTYKHVEFMSEFYGVEITTISAGSVEEQCRKHKRFPMGGARFCTEELKMWPTKRFLRDLAKAQGGFEVWYGMRQDESSHRAKRYEYKDPDELYAPQEVLRKYPQYLQKLGVMYRLPIIDWTEEEVLAYIGEKKNPLYDMGFVRVGCFPCLASGDKWKIRAFEHDEFGKSQLSKVVQLEEELGKSVWGSRIGQRFSDSNQGCVHCTI